LSSSTFVVVPDFPYDSSSKRILQMDIKINPVSKLSGTIEPPGDKSISHRALLLGALATGTTRVTNFLSAQDCISTLRCLTLLGVQIDQRSQHELEIEGVGFDGFKEPSDVLDAGNSGTTLRMLPGILAGLDFFSVLTGDRSLRRRPMKRITAPLIEMGAKIWGREDANLAPIAILGGELSAISHTTPVPSAQVKTALLLAGLRASGKTVVKESFKSRDHTERMLEFLGADIRIDDNAYTISSHSKLSGRQIHVPGDISSAAFFMVASLIVQNSKILIKNVGVNPTRTGILDVLQDMGADISQSNCLDLSNEPRADIAVASSYLKPFDISEPMIPSVIDELPILAVAATQAEGISRLSGAQELRVKESDRIAAICSGLRSLGADIEEKRDGFVIKGPTILRGAQLDSRGDHRLAMALTIAGLIAEGVTTVKEAECINISFPDFHRILQQIAK
jgi:3-phosphoshikimate 1-carboxyvinyltransferase